MIQDLYDLFLRSRTVSTDSRHITPGCLFFALRGEHFDGNAFVPQALEQGAAVCITSDASYASTPRCLVVDDVLAILQSLARHHRQRLSIPVVGITGTNGKTTTKELTLAVLSKRYRTAATRGNLNNHLGVPLTLLSIPADAEMAIVEMGANHPGEIAQLCSIADPDCGLITNVGCAHLEGFGSFEGVVRTKTELYRHLATKNTPSSFPRVFVNADSERLMHESTPLRRFSYGRSEGADLRGTPVHTSSPSPYLHFYFEVSDNVYTAHTHLLGDYNFDNCMAAVAVGLCFGVDPWDIKEAVESYTPSNQRSEFRETDRGNRLYLDCYNANPSSMAAAIASFRQICNTLRQPPAADSQAFHCMAVIGGMHELGDASHSEHQRLVDQLEACRLDRCLLVGPEFEGISLPHPMQLFPDTAAATEWLRLHPVNNSLILVKGSNTNRLWTLEASL